jgi:hypothetical protein
MNSAVQKDDSEFIIYLFDLMSKNKLVKTLISRGMKIKISCQHCGHRTNCIKEFTLL